MALHAWNVEMQREDGQIVNRTVRANWDPGHALTGESVAQAARAEAWWETKKQFDFHVLTVRREPEPEPIAA